MSNHIIGISIIVIILTVTIGLLADAAIAYGIFRFRRLRTIPNIFLANWAIADMLSIILLPTNVAATVFAGGHECACLFIHAIMILHIAAVLFGILLLIDWCTSAYYHRISEKLRKHYILLIGTIWSTVLLFYSLSASLCIAYISYHSTIVLFVILYVINFLLVIALQCSKIVQKVRTNPITYPSLLTVRLTVVTIITLSYLLAVINTSLMYFDVYSSFHIYSHSYLSLTISVISILVNSVVILGILCWLDKDFRLCLFPKQNDLHERFENEISEIEHNDTD